MMVKVKVSVFEIHEFVVCRGVYFFFFLLRTYVCLSLLTHFISKQKKFVYFIHERAELCALLFIYQESEILVTSSSSWLSIHFHLQFDRTIRICCGAPCMAIGPQANDVDRQTDEPRTNRNFMAARVNAYESVCE